MFQVSLTAFCFPAYGQNDSVFCSIRFHRWKTEHLSCCRQQNRRKLNKVFDFQNRMTAEACVADSINLCCISECLQPQNAQKGAAVWSEPTISMEDSAAQAWQTSTILPSGMLRHCDMKCSSEPQAVEIWKSWKSTQSCQHLQQHFSRELTYSFLTNSWCQLWIRSYITGFLNHQEERNMCSVWTDSASLQ